MSQYMRYPKIQKFRESSATSALKMRGLQATNLRRIHLNDISQDLFRTVSLCPYCEDSVVIQDKYVEFVDYFHVRREDAVEKRLTIAVTYYDDRDPNKVPM